MEEGITGTISPIGTLSKTTQKSIQRTIELDGTNNLQTRQTLWGTLQAYSTETKITQQLVTPILTLMRARVKAAQSSLNDTISIITQKALQGHKMATGSITGTGSVDDKHINKTINPVLLLQHQRTRWITFTLQRTGIITRKIILAVSVLAFTSIKHIWAAARHVIEIPASRIRNGPFRKRIF